MRRWVFPMLACATFALGCRERVAPAHLDGAAAPRTTSPAADSATVGAVGSAPAGSTAEAGSGEGPKEEARAAALSDPWESPEACALALGRPAPRKDGVARLATWNLRWFPDGGPGKKPRPEGATDVTWLACALASLRVDLVAVQEVKTHAGALEAAARLTAALDAHTGGQWKLAVDDCPNLAGQHVGVLYDARRVEARGLARYDALNPHGEGCKDQLRPGYGGYFRFGGGLDLHLVSVHLKSGPERRSLELRARSLAALPATRAAAQALAPDPDVILAGDFNTMGCAQCSPKLGAESELAALDVSLATSGFRRVAADLGCSEYFRGGGVLLDHFVVAAAMAEVPAAATAQVDGYCGRAACRALRGAPPRAREVLSDHCPVVLELPDHDRD